MVKSKITHTRNWIPVTVSSFPFISVFFLRSRFFRLRDFDITVSALIFTVGESTFTASALIFTVAESTFTVSESTWTAGALIFTVGESTFTVSESTLTAVIVRILFDCWRIECAVTKLIDCWLIRIACMLILTNNTLMYEKNQRSNFNQRLRKDFVLRGGYAILVRVPT